MPIATLKNFLESHHVPYAVIGHPVTYTAAETAHSAHISGKMLAKTVMVNLDGDLAMAVLPASERVDPEQLRQAMGANHAELAREEEFMYQFPDCDIGGMPPFGNLYGLRVIVDESLARDPEIAFNSGSHRELVRLAYKDYEDLVNPTVAHIAKEHTL